jgi:DNA-binding transcriptional ArsR family regulator
VGEIDHLLVYAQNGIYDRIVEDAFAAIADPARRRLLDLLLAAPHGVGELSGAAGLSQPSTSKHLRVLRDAGLVTVRREAQRRVYAVRLDGLEEAARWLTPYVLRRQQELAHGGG